MAPCTSQSPPARPRRVCASGSGLTTIGIQAHTGTLFGLVNQLALAAMALGLLAMLFWGYRMWWSRRPTRATGAPAPRGELTKLSRPVLLVIVVVTAGLGWLIPLLGISLLLFLAADQAWTRIRQRQSPPAEVEALGGGGPSGSATPR